MIVSRYCTHIIDLCSSGDALISEATLTELLALDSQEKRIRQREAALLAEMQDKQQRIRSRDRRLAAHRLKRQKVYARRLYLKAQAKGQRAALQWLVEEQQWEKEVISIVMNKVCSALTAHLQEQIPELAWEKVLQARLRKILQHPGITHPLKLRVPAEMEMKLAETAATLSLTLEALPEGVSGYAWIENEVVRVKIPLEQQLDSLLESLQPLKLVGGRDGGS